jgi:hypothetical protein
MSMSFDSNQITVDGESFSMPWPVLDAIELGERLIVLFDPDAYLSDQDYRKKRRLGAPAIRNLVAFSRKGERLWEAEFPERSDYYYKIVSAQPLVALAFSSFRCEIDTDDGKIVGKSFTK